MNLAKRFALVALCVASLAQAKGWTVVDMKNDWKIITHPRYRLMMGE